MKRNRTQALKFVLDHRNKILKGLGALLQILEKLPDDVSIADLLAAGKAAPKKTASKKAGPKARAKPQKTKPEPAAVGVSEEQPAESPEPAPMPSSVDEPPAETPLP